MIPLKQGWIRLHHIANRYICDYFVTETEYELLCYIK
jgi:hypothetical protein